MKIWSFPADAVVKNLPVNAGDTREEGSIPGSGRFPGEGTGNPLNPVFLPGKSHGQRSLVGYSQWDCKELDITECTHIHYENLWQKVVYIQACIFKKVNIFNLLLLSNKKWESNNVSKATEVFEESFWRLKTWLCHQKNSVASIRKLTSAPLKII